MPNVSRVVRKWFFFHILLIDSLCNIIGIYAYPLVVILFIGIDSNEIILPVHNMYLYEGVHCYVCNKILEAVQCPYVEYCLWNI